MNKISALIIITITMMFSACNGDKTDQKLISIDLTLRHHPDSAFKLLNGIKSQKDFTEKDKAYYGLLLTESAWRSHLPLTSDLLIRESEEYYSKNDGIEKKARSSLYRGVLLMNKKQYAKAVLYLKKAESMIDQLHDPHLIYQIYAYIGWMNERNGADGMALTYYRRAYEYAKISNPILKYNQLRVIYEYTIKEGDYQKALEVYRQLAELSDSFKVSRNHSEIIDIQNKYDQEVAKREKSEMILWYSMIIIILLILIFTLAVWFYYRMQNLYKKYRSGMNEIKQEMTDKLYDKNGTIVDLQSRIKMLSESVNAKIERIDQLKRQIKKLPFSHSEYDLNEIYD